MANWDNVNLKIDINAKFHQGVQDLVNGKRQRFPKRKQEPVII